MITIRLLLSACVRALPGTEARAEEDVNLGVCMCQPGHLCIFANYATHLRHVRMKGIGANYNHCMHLYRSRNV